jgi:hypothetical protein
MVKQDPTKLVILSLHQRGLIWGKGTAVLARTEGSNAFYHAEDWLKVIINPGPNGSATDLRTNEHV